LVIVIVLIALNSTVFKGCLTVNYQVSYS